MLRLFNWAKRVLPVISATERAALQSGTTSFERFIFDGSMTMAKLTPYPPVDLSDRDKEMLQRVPYVANVIHEHEILQQSAMLPSHMFWSVAKRQGMFALTIDESYGGHKMSPTGLSLLLQRMGSHSAAGSVHIMVPNSLGPAELLHAYGTAAQKEYWLPQLAAGAIPCFGLTGPESGSDAASMKDRGRVYDTPEGPRIKLSLDKRYITLAPVADVVGVAFKLDDEEQRIGTTGDICLALMKRDTPGLCIGERHDPLGIGFMNGPIRGEVDISVDDIIGGADGIGKGWNMLMECLAAGRGICLPAGAAGSSKMLTCTTGAYTTVRKQFNVPIHAFEGIQEKLARMVQATVEIDSLVSLFNAVLERGESPAVLSAVLKYRTTELGRQVVLDSMDVTGGAAICRGPSNWQASAYQASPISITVEGSNTLTRSMIVFGQGLNRSHPTIQTLLQSIEDDDVDAFSNAVFETISLNVRNFFRPATDVERWVKFFSLSSNASLLLGGSLKFKEFLSGRYADMLTDIVTLYAIERYVDLHGLDHVHEALMKRVVHRMQENASQLVKNHPHTRLHAFLYRWCVKESNELWDDGDTSLLAKEAYEDGTLQKLWYDDYLRVHPQVGRLHRAFRVGHTVPELDRQIIAVDSEPL